MAIPGNVLASQNFPSSFIGGRGFPVTPLRDFETGGVAFNDSSKGLQYQVWRARILNEGSDIVVDADEVSETTLYSGTDITEVSLTFDQNMRPALAFVEGGSAKLRWYDSQVEQQVVTTWGSDYITPRVALDDKRYHQTGQSDIVFAYIRNGNLYYREQRDRYDVEYLLKSDVGSPGIIKIGMNRLNRFQFLMRWP